MSDLLTTIREHSHQFVREWAFLQDQHVSAAQSLNEQADQRIGQALALLSEAEQETLLQGMALYVRALQRRRIQHASVLRSIQPADNEAIAALILRVMTEYGAIGPGYSIEDIEIQAMAEAYAGPGAAFFVWEQTGEIIGCGGIAPLAGADSGICELRKMYFLPEARGLGLGRRLLQMCLDTARSQGYHTCYLETIGSMTQARKLYEAMGFVRRDAALGRTGHFSCDAFMEKIL